MPRKQKTSQMGDNAFRWENKSQFDSEWIPYIEEDLEELRKLKEKKSKYKKRDKEIYQENIDLENR